jgi:hypothetical protein
VAPRTGLAVSGLVMLVVLAACTNYDPRGYDDAPPTASPATTPQPQPSASTSSNLHVVLDHATNDDVTVDVTDASGTLLTAVSGSPGDGASVEPYKLHVGNDGASTLRLTWVGGPCDSANSLSIDATARRFLLVQPECAGDSLVTDRILILRFSAPIAATDVQGFLQDGLDTQG